MDKSIGQVDPLGGLVLDQSNELRFRRPFDTEFSTVTILISNPTDKRIAFKTKLTAPKRYCVKPNCGVLDPTKSMKVNVLLQSFNHDPNEIFKHKFMVQYTYLTDEENKMHLQDILKKWTDLPYGRLFDIKLKCIIETESHDKEIPTSTTITAPAEALVSQATTDKSNSDSYNNQTSNDNYSELKAGEAIF